MPSAIVLHTPSTTDARPVAVFASGRAGDATTGSPPRFESFGAGGSDHKLAVILHADVVGSTALVQRDERMAHDRIQDAFRRFADTIESYGGTAHEVRGDAAAGRI